MKINKNFTVLLLILIVLNSFFCRKVIDIDLNSSNPRIVIDATLRVSSNPEVAKTLFNRRLKLSEAPSQAPLINCRVFVVKTVNFDEENNFDDIIDQSTVKITNQTKDVSIELEKHHTPEFNKSDRFYKQGYIEASPKDTITLEVQYNGETYTSTAIVPDYVQLDNFYLRAEEAQGFSLDDGQTDEDFKTPIVSFKEIENKKNYYIFNIRRYDETALTLERYSSYNDELYHVVPYEQYETNYFLDEDLFNIDGKDFNDYELPGLIVVTRNDSVITTFSNTNKDVYTYFRQLYESNGNPTSLTPFTPKGNITGNNVIGFFNVEAIDRKSVVVKD